jgi:hypothetical protein
MTQQEIIEITRKTLLASWHKDLKKWQIEQGFETFAKLVAAKEREECAKVFEPQEAHDDPLTAWKIAQAIRARGET